MFLTFLILGNCRLVNYVCNHTTTEYLLLKSSFCLLNLSHLSFHVCLDIRVCDPLGLIGVAWMCMYGDPNSVCDALPVTEWLKIYVFTCFSNYDLTIVPQGVLGTQESSMYNSRRNCATFLQISRIALSLREQLKNHMMLFIVLFSVSDSSIVSLFFCDILKCCLSNWLLNIWVYSH